MLVHFQSEAKEKHKEKLSLIGNVHVDPLAITENAKSADSVAALNALPNVDGSDLVSYLVLQTSFVTVESISSWQSCSI